MRRRTLIFFGLAATLATAIAWLQPRRWRYIIVHHSGGASGDLDLLRRVHRERQPNDPIDMIPYHFLIGNGQGMKLGEVIETSRWRKGLWGAHVRSVARNARGIGICLIGNFETAEVPEPQYAALVDLTRKLMEEHRISSDNVTLHGATPGEQTLCPGKNFPRETFLAAISA